MASSLSVVGVESRADRTAKWALSFDNLLADPAGLYAFMTFAEREFSDENLRFWIACDNFVKLNDPDEIKAEAQRIFERFLSPTAAEPVNVDSNARKVASLGLSMPSNSTFAVAQSQIYQLMRQDSYKRFLISDVFQSCVESDIQGRPLPELKPTATAKRGRKSGGRPSTTLRLSAWYASKHFRPRFSLPTTSSKKKAKDPAPTTEIQDENRFESTVKQTSGGYNTRSKKKAAAAEKARRKSVACPGEQPATQAKSSSNSSLKYLSEEEVAMAQRVTKTCGRSITPKPPPASTGKKERVKSPLENVINTAAQIGRMRDSEEDFFDSLVCDAQLRADQKALFHYRSQPIQQPKDPRRISTVSSAGSTSSCPASAADNLLFKPPLPVRTRDNRRRSTAIDQPQRPRPRSTVEVVQAENESDYQLLWTDSQPEIRRASIRRFSNLMPPPPPVPPKELRRPCPPPPPGRRLLIAKSISSLEALYL